MRTNFIESKIEEDIAMKNQYIMKNPKDPLSIREAASMKYTDTLFIVLSIIRNTAQIDFNDKNMDIFRFVKINSMLAVGEHQTAK